MNTCTAEFQIGAEVFPCVRSAGHKDTGHEYMGEYRGNHIHVVWGEPAEGDKT